MSAVTTPSLPTSGSWEIDSLHSTVTFSVTHHSVAKFRGIFPLVRGSYSADAGTLRGEVAVRSIPLGGLPPLEALREHLMSERFFCADAFPTLSFSAADVILDGTELTASGELTIRGVTRPVAAVGTYRGPQEVDSPMGFTDRIGMNLQATIDRRDWGMTYNNDVVEGVLNLGWDVKIEATLELSTPKA